MATLKTQSRLLKVDEVMKILQCSKDKAYKTIRELNAELNELGYRTKQGSIIDTYLYKRYGLDKDKWS